VLGECFAEAITYNLISFPQIGVVIPTFIHNSPLVFNNTILSIAVKQKILKIEERKRLVNTRFLAIIAPVGKSYAQDQMSDIRFRISDRKYIFCL